MSGSDGRLVGIWGYPFIDLDGYLDPGQVASLHDELCLGLTKVRTTYTGGTLKWMGIVSPEVAQDPYLDAMEVVSRLSPADYARFLSLGDDPALRPDAPLPPFGDETDHPFTRAQMLWLEQRHGVYFPWKTVFHFVENHRWEDKNHGGGKVFTEEARLHFPKTVALLGALPFREIGRALLFGVQPNDHAPVHRDTAPDPDAPVAHCLTLMPGDEKRFFLLSPDRSRRVQPRSRAYWFNDMDWHGVEAGPRFQYSIRIDGVFEDAFLERLRRDLCR
jgi:hypothetical protein